MNKPLSFTLAGVAVLLLVLFPTTKIAAQDPTLDAAIIQATSKARATQNALQATRVAIKQTTEVVVAQQTVEAIQLTRMADATRQALDTQARQQEIALTGTALAHQESINATATAVSLDAQQQGINATATAQSLRAQAMQQMFDKQATANISVIVLSVAIAIALVLIGLGVFRFLRSRPAPVTIITAEAAQVIESKGEPVITPVPPVNSEVPQTIVVDATQDGLPKEMAQVIADALGDKLP